MISPIDLDPEDTGRSIRFLQHRGCLDCANNKQKQNTIEGAVEVFESFSRETKTEHPWFFGIEMDVNWVPSVDRGKGEWIATHDPPDLLNADAAPPDRLVPFSDYLEAVVPYLLKCGKVLNVEIKDGGRPSNIPSDAFQVLSALIKEKFAMLIAPEHVNVDPVNFIIFTSFWRETLQAFAEQGYRTGLFVHHNAKDDETVLSSSVVLPLDTVESGFQWAQGLVNTKKRSIDMINESEHESILKTSAGRRMKAHIFLIVRLHASNIRVQEKDLHTWERRALQSSSSSLALSLWYNGLSARDCRKVLLTRRAVKRVLERSVHKTVETVEGGDRDVDETLIIIDDRLPLLPSEAEYQRLYEGRKSGVEWAQ